MSTHRVYIPSVHAEDILDLPDGVHITGATVADGELVLEVASNEDLGSAKVNALYGNVEEDSTQLVFGMFEARK